MGRPPVHPARLRRRTRPPRDPFRPRDAQLGKRSARDLLVEVSLFNAGPTQQQDIAAFFNKPAGPDERIPGIAPLNRLSIRNSIVVARSNIQMVELGGNQVYVPVVAFNVHYRGTGGDAQTSASYLVGRDTGGDKLGPLQLGRGRARSPVLASARCRSPSGDKPYRTLLL